MQKLADERVELTRQLVEDAVVLLSGLKLDEKNKWLTNKALWGLAAAWDESFADNGKKVAAFLVKGGANPKTKVIIGECFCLKKRDGRFSYTALEMREMTAMEVAHGTLKQYLETI